MSEQPALKPRPSWASLDGHLVIHPPTSSPTENEVLDRLLIVETLHRYGWSYDERIRDVLESCFTEDFTFEGSVGGEVAIGPFSGRTVFMDWLTAYWDSQEDQRRHIVLNPLIDELGSARATTTTMMMLTSAYQGQLKVVTAGFYSCEMRKVKGQWLIARMMAGFDVPY